MRLKDMREDRDITQKEIAEFLHIKPKYLFAV